MKMGGCKVFTSPEPEEKKFDAFYTLSLSKNNNTLLISWPLNLSSWAKAQGKVKDNILSLDTCTSI